jgi:hypothetical protein
MSIYNRITRKCAVSQLRPELRKAVQDYFNALLLGDPEGLSCYETTSERKSTRKLISWLDDQPDRTIYTAILLTPERLIWVRGGDRSETVMKAAHLKNIQVKVYTSWLMKDAGLEVSGEMEGSKGWIRGYLGMESEAIAQLFYDEVKPAIDKVKPPRKRRISWWWSGSDRE